MSAPTKYNLVANLCHEGTFDHGAYKVHLQCRVRSPFPSKCLSRALSMYPSVRPFFPYASARAHQATEQWYEIQDLMVRETMPQLISLSESYIQIYGAPSIPHLRASPCPPPDPYAVVCEHCSSDDLCVCMRVCAYVYVQNSSICRPYRKVPSPPLEPPGHDRMGSVSSSSTSSWINFARRGTRRRRAGRRRE